jgi:hypothetical protein
MFLTQSSPTPTQSLGASLSDLAFSNSESAQLLAQPQFLDIAAVRSHLDRYARRLRPLDGRSALVLTRLASQTYHSGLAAPAITAVDPIASDPASDPISDGKSDLTSDFDGPPTASLRLPDWAPWPQTDLAVPLFLEADLVAIFADRLEISPARAATVLRELADADCLRVDESGHWRFESPMFHSYLSARWFSYAAEWDELMPHLTDMNWRPVWLMILALLPNADRLLRRMKTHLELLAHIQDEGSDLPLWYVAHQTLVSGLSVAQTVSPMLRSAINELLEG